jgi:transcriptional regulator with XRE-family HTH domain
MAVTAMAERIKEAREARGFTASELARLTAVTPTAVWNWESNGVKPRPENLALVAKVLAVTPEFLLTGDEDQVLSSARGVPEIISDAEAEIAKATGLAAGRVKIRVEVLPA